MLQPSYAAQIPEMTKLVAKAAFPDGSLAIDLRDQLGPIFEDTDFTALYPEMGQPALSPARLALVTLLQFADDLPDRQAAIAVRGRIDWKYALGLELTDPGFHYSVLCEFRQRLVDGDSARLLLEKMLHHCATKGLLSGKHKQRTDSTHVIAAVRTLSLLELVGETMRYVLNAIASIAPDWLRAHMPFEWIPRYEHHFEVYRLPKAKAERDTLAVQIGRDGFALMKELFAPTTPAEVRMLPLVDVLRRIWIQQFYQTEDKVYWRTKKEWGQPPANVMISSPQDLDIHYCVKRSTEWTGYKVHFTETCDTEHPRLITQVETTTATTHDVKVTQTIQANLTERRIQPDMHLVDEGYMETNLLLSSQNQGINLVGPVPSHKSWQSRSEEAFDHTQFEINWEAKQATCPGGKTSVHYGERKTWRGTPNVLFAFRLEDCQACPLRERCTRAKNVGRTLTVYPQEEYAIQEQARQRQATAEFKELYRQRAGIEGTISAAVRGKDVRHARYIGLKRTHLQHVAIAAAMNASRVVNWLAGEGPGTTRRSPLRALAP